MSRGVLLVNLNVGFLERVRERGRGIKKRRKRLRERMGEDERVKAVEELERKVERLYLFV